MDAPSPKPSTDEFRRKGIVAARAGQVTLARLLLRRAAIDDPSSAETWYWLGQVEQTAERRADCLRRALALDPSHVAARAGLDQITQTQRRSDDRRSPTAAPRPPTAVAPTPPAAPRPSSPVVKPTPILTAPPPAARGGSPSALAPFRPLLAFLIGVLLVGAPALYLHSTGRLQALRPAARIIPASTPIAEPTRRPALPRPTQVAEPTAPEAPPPLVAPTQEIDSAEQGALAARYYAEAFALLTQKKYPDAILALDRVIAFAPTYGPAYNDRGYAYLHLATAEHTSATARADVWQAMADLDRAVTLLPTDSAPYANRAAAYEFLARLELYRDVRHQYRLQALNNLIQAQALGDPSIRDEKLAVAYLAAGQCEAAFQIYDELLQTTFAPHLFAGRAAARECLGDLRAALSDIDRALAEARDHGEWLTLRASILRDLGEFEVALREIDKAIQLAPYSGSQRYFLRATLYYDLGQTDLALEDLRIGASNRDEVWGEMYYLLGRLALNRGQRAAAAEYFALATATLDEGPFLRRVREEMTRSGLG